MLTNTADIELFLDRHYEDIYWVSEKILAATAPAIGAAFLHPLNSFSWSQFEWFCAQLLRVQGWKIECLDPNVSCGQAAFNSPADIIAVKNNQRLFVSCKRHAALIPERFIQEIINVRDKHQHNIFSNFSKSACLMTTNFFEEEAENLANQNKIECLDLHEIKKLNLKFLISENRTHKWQPKFGKFARIEREHQEFASRNRQLIQHNQTLRQQITNEQLERKKLENARTELENQINEAKGQVEILHHNWQTETNLRQNIEREIYDLNQGIDQNQEQKNKIDQQIQELTTKINQQERELEREKAHNQVNTKINFGLLKEKHNLLTDFQIKTQEITEHLHHKLEAEKVWFWTSMAVLCLFAMLAVGIVWN